MTQLAHYLNTQLRRCTTQKVKPESKLWALVKKKTPKINWIRLEASSGLSSQGLPDLLGYSDSCGFFMLELKIAHSPKISFSPHQKLFAMTRSKRNYILCQHAPRASGRDKKQMTVKLYNSSAIHGLLIDHRETPCLAQDDWDHIQRLLLNEPTDG